MKNISPIAIGIVIIVLAFVGYGVFFAPKSEEGLTQSAAVTDPDQDIIVLLLQLKSMTLDNRIFSYPRFSSLRDFGQELRAEPVGRQNPFASFSEVRSGPTQTSTQTAP